MSASATPPTATSERGVLFTLAGVQFTHIMDFMIMMPMGAGLMRVFQISPTQFSHLVASYGLSAAVTSFLAGFVIDRFDRKRALLTLYAGFALSTVGCALAPSFAWLLIARAMAGACGGLAGSIVSAMVGDVVPPARRGRAMGVVMTAFPLASVLGVPVGLTLVDAFSWHAPFVLLAVLSVPIWLTASRFLPSLPPAAEKAHPGKQMWAILSHPVHQRGFLLSGALVFAGATIIPFMAPSMVANVGLPESQLKYIYFFGGAATFFSTRLFGWLSDHFDKVHVLAGISLLATVTALTVTRLGPTPIWLILVMTSVFFVTMSGRFSPAMSMLSNAVDARYRGGFMSVNSAIQQAFSGLANVTAGLLVYPGPEGHLLGYPRVGYVAAGAFLLTVFLAHRVKQIAPHAARPGGHAPAPATATPVAAVAD